MQFPANIPLGHAIFNPAATAAGTTQANATPLDALTSVVTTVPAGSGVRLDPMLMERQTVINGGANVLSVYPQPGMMIAGLALNAPFQIAPGAGAGFLVVSAIQAFAVFGTPSRFT